MAETQDLPTLIALMSGPDCSGIVARTAGFIYERGGNILHADQHHDHAANIFFQRLEWQPKPDADVAEECAAFRSLAQDDLGMDLRLVRSTDRPRVSILVSKIDHCFHDTILRWRAGEMRGELACVISNHETLREASEGYCLPFYHVPVSRQTRPKSDEAMLTILRNEGVELAVMARYMQVLSDDFLRAFGHPVINIHHSFLPAFAGGKPYHQAHERGVKLIGATAHYATAELDAGPIIHQDTTPISHRHGVPELIRRGRDLEKRVFADAIRWHLDHRILVYNNKTVVLD